jgi:hypothetical protein
MHPGLVHDDVRELGQPVLDILDPASADDVGPLIVVWVPETRLVDPVRLLEDALAEAERLKHLQGPARDSVGLADEEPTWLLIHDPGRDIGKGCELRRERQPCWSAAHDENVDLSGLTVCRLQFTVLVHRLGNTGISGLVAVEVKLHGATSQCVAGLRAAVQCIEPGVLGDAIRSAILLLALAARPCASAETADSGDEWFNRSSRGAPGSRARPLPGSRRDRA